MSLCCERSSGDTHAFDELVRAHWEIAFRLAYVITRNAADAEDVAQEAMLKGWRALARFRSSEPLRPWLLRIVANEARNRRRSAGRRARSRCARTPRPGLGGRGPVPRGPRRRGRRAPPAARASSRQLPEQARTVLACRYLLDLSEAETAAALGLRPGTVKSRTARALERLREIHG